MADNTPRWIRDAQRIASTPSAKPTYTSPPPYQQRQVTQAEINRIRNVPANTGKAGKS